MRKRLRDWPQKVYKYRCYVESRDTFNQFPECVKKEAFGMREGWNLLVKMFEEKKSLKEIRNARLRPEFKKLYWTNTDFVIDSFLAARSRYLKALKQHNFKVGPPKRQTRLRKLHFRHRFTGGGRVWKQVVKSRRLSLEPIGDLLVSRFMLGDEGINVRIIFDRPLPDKAIIKSVSLIANQLYDAGIRGERISWDRWQWGFLIQFEYPPESSETDSDPRPMAGLDLNWRHFKEGIRFASIVDSENHVEHYFLPSKLLKRWNWTRELKRKRDIILEETKAKLKESGKPVAWNSRAKGLWQRLREETDPIIKAVLYRWASIHTKILREEKGVDRRVRRWREHIQRNITLSLCRKYGKIFVEDLAVKEMSEQDTENYALRESGKYRQLVAPGRFLLLLREAATKTNTEIIKVDPFETTVRCSVCGEKAEQNGKVDLECANGHRWDQDYNAARNLLSFANLTRSEAV